MRRRGLAPPRCAGCPSRSSAKSSTRRAAPADLEHRPDEDPHLVAHEAGGLDPELEHVVADASTHSAAVMLRSKQHVLGLGRRERREVVLPGQQRGAGVERLAVERVRPVERAAALERRQRVARVEAVAVGARRWRRGGRRSRPARARSRARARRGGRLPFHAPSGSGSPAWLATWPSACTPASVRPATVSSAGSPRTVASTSSSTPCTVRWPGLARPAREPRAVVLDEELRASAALAGDDEQVFALDPTEPSSAWLNSLDELPEPAHRLVVALRAERLLDRPPAGRSSPSPTIIASTESNSNGTVRRSISSVPARPSKRSLHDVLDPPLDRRRNALRARDELVEEAEHPAGEPVRHPVRHARRCSPAASTRNSSSRDTLGPRREHRAEDRRGAVEAVVLERQLLGVGLDPLESTPSAAARSLPALHQLRREVGGHDARALRGGEQREVARARADVEHLLPGRDRARVEQRPALAGSVSSLDRRVVAERSRGARASCP